MLPMLLGQVAGQLRELTAEEIDGMLLFVAKECLMARSLDAGPRVALVAEVRHPEGGYVYDFDAIGRVAAALEVDVLGRQREDLGDGAPHNED